MKIIYNFFSHKYFLMKGCAFCLPVDNNKKYHITLQFLDIEKDETDVDFIKRCKKELQDKYSQKTNIINIIYGDKWGRNSYFVTLNIYGIILTKQSGDSNINLHIDTKGIDPKMIIPSLYMMAKLSNVYLVYVR